jgi:outer membrane protein assembly factor BamD (BamD/ComL family)
MKRTLALLLLLVHPAIGQSAVSFQEAEQALAEGIPQVAIVKLNAVLAKKSLPKADREKAGWLLAEAQLAAGNTEGALATVAKLPERTDTPSLLLRANIEAGARHWGNAFRHYQEISTRPDAPVAAALGEAESLQALGRTVEAIATLRRAAAKRPLPPAGHLRLASLYVEVDRANDARKSIEAAQASSPADQKWQRHLEARILLLEKNPREALAVLEALLADKSGLSQNLVAAAVLAMAEARLALAGPDAASKTLETFIRKNSDSPQLELIFRRLDQIYATDTNPTEGVLHGIAGDPDLSPRARALAQFYVTRLQWREERYDRAMKSIEIFLRKFPGHELTPYAYLMQADIYKQTDPPNWSAAEVSYDSASRTATSPEVRAESALEAALINLQQGKFEQAATRLKGAENFPRLRQTAAYNAALGWLLQQNYTRFREELGAFAAQFQSPALIGQLRLEEGLVQARHGHATAMDTLKTFLREFPEHGRKTEAQIAMAELAFLRGDNGQAETLLVAAKNDAADPAAAEQAEYLAVFLADKKQPRDPAEVIRLARDFISRRPRSPMLSAIRMKLGQVYFAEEDFLKAQEQFESLATSDPAGIYSEMALFLAGQCGMRLINTDALNHAIELFDKVAERKGGLETRARLQQAIIKNKLGAEDDAVKIYDTIISAPVEPDPEVRYAALIGKGDNLAVIAQERPADDPLRERALKDAVQTYNLLIAMKDAPPNWTNQAAYKKGKALLQLGSSDEALTEFYDVLNRNTAPPHETFWYAKAGFDAAALLEAKQNWKNAVSVYQKMTLVPGPHVVQAKQRVTTLRLEHYLFD